MNQKFNKMFYACSKPLRGLNTDGLPCGRVESAISFDSVNSTEFSFSKHIPALFPFPKPPLMIHSIGCESFPVLSTLALKNLISQFRREID